MVANSIGNLNWDYDHSLREGIFFGGKSGEVQFVLIRCGQFATVKCNSVLHKSKKKINIISKHINQFKFFNFSYSVLETYYVSNI